MKQILLTQAFLSTLLAQGQYRDEQFFNHLSLGLNLGTNGIGLEAAAPLGPIVSFRAGVDYMPKFTITQTINYKRPAAFNNIDPSVLEERYANIPENGVDVEVKGTPNLLQGKVLFDIYTSTDTRFHFTLGAHYSDKVRARLKAEDKTIAAVELYNQDIKNGKITPEPGYEDGIKLQLEGYPITLSKGRAEIDLTTNKIRPYLGIGWGRVIPRRAVNCTFDLGVSYLGKAKLIDKYGGNEITKDDPRISADFSDVINYINKVPVELTLQITIRGKLF